jgi:DNA-binding GntR family transcriptional regulator
VGKIAQKKGHLGNEEVYQFLRDKLIKLEFRPGHLLSESELVSKFNLSRTPVRNALSKMERDGLVEIVPRKGAFIKFLSMKDIKEIFEIRKSLEGTVVGLTVNRLDLERLNQFEQFYLRSLNDPKKNLEEISSVGMEFHEFFVISAGNERIRKILDDLRVQLSICRIFFVNQNSNVLPSRAVESIREHLSIIDAVKKGDGELAERKMKEHLTNAENYTFSFG